MEVMTSLVQMDHGMAKGEATSDSGPNISPDFIKKKGRKKTGNDNIG